MVQVAAPTGVTATQSINKDVSNKEDYVREYSVTALLSDGSQESVRSESISLKCNPYGDGAFNTITWDAVLGAGLYRVYRNQGGIWAYIGQTSDTKIIDENIDPDASITPPLYDDAFVQKSGITSVAITDGGSGYESNKRYELVASDETGTGFDGYALATNGKIAQVVIRSHGSNYKSPTVTVKANASKAATLSATVGDVGDYPGSVTYFEQRRWFGGTYTRPNNLWATKSGTESVLSYSLPTQDTDRISVRVAARESSRIQHIVPLAHLMLLTGSAEWRVSPLNDDAITPASMSVRPQSYVGANNVQPLVINSTMVYVANRGGHLRECGYNYQAGGFVSNDICLRAPHLFDNLEVTDMAFGKAPWPIAWAVSNDGKLIALTYVPEQQVGAFSTIETKGAFKSCCVVAEGDEDILYCVIERTINGVTKQLVERMHERQVASLEESNYMDCSGVYKGEAKKEIGGLDWLEGESVSILADGSVEPSQVVNGGKINLQYPASTVRIGIPYECDIKTLPLALALQDGSYGSGHKKNVRKVFFRTVNSSGLKSGPTFDTLTTYAPRSTEFAGNPPNPITDEFGFVISAAWSNDGQVCVRQDLPLPMRVVSMTIEVEMA